MAGLTKIGRHDIKISSWSRHLHIMTDCVCPGLKPGCGVYPLQLLMESKYHSKDGCLPCHGEIWRVKVLPEVKIQNWADKRVPLDCQATANKEWNMVDIDPPKLPSRPNQGNKWICCCVHCMAHSFFGQLHRTSEAVLSCVQDTTPNNRYFGTDHSTLISLRTLQSEPSSS